MLSRWDGPFYVVSVVLQIDSNGTCLEASQMVKRPCESSTPSSIIYRLYQTKLGHTKVVVGDTMDE
jgi:hypothetical protein